MKKITAVFLCALMLMCGAAWAADGPAGLKPLEAEDFSVSDGKNTIVLDSPFTDFEIDLPEEETSYVGEEYTGDFVYKVYQHTYADFNLYTSNRYYNLKDRNFDYYYIVQITLKTPNFKTNRGISVGAHVDDLLKAYGPGEESNDDGVICLLYTLGDMRLQFDMRNQRVQGITAFVYANEDN